MTSREMKEIAFRLGADLCGIASVDRLSEAPKGFHPTDVLPGCRSVISFACRFPVGALACRTDVVYTRIRNSISAKMDALALDFCIELEKQGVLAVPIPTIEAQWDASTQRSRSIISLKHAAQAAGLGTIGRHSLLITPEFGSMVWLGAILTTAALEPDPLLEPVCNDCGLCTAACPISALENREMDQNACWNYAFGEDPNTHIWVISCHKCRDTCPYNLGTENQNILT